MKQRIAKLGATAKVEGLPVTIEDLKALGHFEFENWVIQRVQGTPSPKQVHDMGIDGYSFFELLPIQVKQREHIGREFVDNFETAVKRVGKEKGYIIAFSFTRGARGEVARAKSEEGIEIELVEVSRLLQEPRRRAPTLDEIFPALPKSFLDLPLPPPRPRGDLPSADDLIKSRRQKAEERAG